jgi:hypothetical protein
MDLRRRPLNCGYVPRPFRYTGVVSRPSIPPFPICLADSPHMDVNIASWTSRSDPRTHTTRHPSHCLLLLIYICLTYNLPTSPPSASTFTHETWRLINVTSTTFTQSYPTSPDRIDLSLFYLLPTPFSCSIISLSDAGHCMPARAPADGFTVSIDRRFVLEDDGSQRFHIKWKNFSHLHNTDETYEFLKRFRRLKRVDNYIKAYKIWQSRLAVPGLSREDVETLHFDKEREKEDLETFRTVERIIAHRETTDGDVEYFCKWCGLNYNHCTWELQKDVNPIAKEQIAAYRKREAEAKFPYKSVSYSRHGRPAFQKIDRDPPYIEVTGGELKDFQLTYLWSKGENGILADEMGLGKVSTLLLFCILLFR